jgi:hypothetical protein
LIKSHPLPIAKAKHGIEKKERKRKHAGVDLLKRPWG